MENRAYDLNADNVLVLRQEAEASRSKSADVEAQGSDSMVTNGRRMLELVHQAMASIRQREERAASIAFDALEQVKAMKERNKALELRLQQAEAQARAAELWVRRLHAELESQLGAIESEFFVQGQAEPEKLAA